MFTVLHVPIIVSMLRNAVKSQSRPLKISLHRCSPLSLVEIHARSSFSTLYKKTTIKNKEEVKCLSNVSFYFKIMAEKKFTFVIPPEHVRRKRTESRRRRRSTFHS